MKLRLDRPLPFLRLSLVCLVCLLTPGAAGADETVFAIIGDYGTGDEGGYEGNVAEMVFGWNPDFVLTVGDNNYQGDWNKSTYDEVVGNYWCRFMYPTPDGRTKDWQGVDCASVSHSSGETNFLPTPGNHDWSQDDDDDEEGYLGYENYFEPASGQNIEFDSITHYTWSRGNVLFYGINSNCLCQSSTSGGGSSNCNGLDDGDFAAWLLKALSSSSAKQNWNVVYFHHPPYNSGHHGGCSDMGFVWDAIVANGVQNNTLVVSGHEHQYQRTVMDQNNSTSKVLFLIAGLSGDHSATSSTNQCCTTTITHPKNGTVEENYCYIEHKGALKVIADSDSLVAEYYYRDNVSGKNTPYLLDTCTLSQGSAPTCSFASTSNVSNCL